MDDIDRAITQALAAEGRLSMTELGRRIGLSRTAVLARVRRMEREELIRGYHADVANPDDVRRHTARVGIETDTRNTSRYVRSLSGLPGFVEAETVSGSFDLLVRFETDTAADLDALLDEIKTWPATIRTTTFVVLRRYGTRDDPP